MLTKDTNYWIDFFLAAKLPQSVATKYAMIFSDHRIQESMLEDLTKDMLYDMGIKTIGDIIAILKHAREVADERIQYELMSRHISEAKRVMPQPTLANRASSTHQPISGPNVSSSTATRPPRRKVEIDEPRTSIEPKFKRVVSSPAVTRNVAAVGKITPTARTVTFSEGKLNRSARQDSANSSIFQRLGAGSSDKNRSINVKARITDHKSPTSRVVTGSSRITIGSDTRKPRIGEGVKQRLGSTNNSGKQSDKFRINSRQIVSSTLRSKQNKGTMISLKKSIFDRLGNRTF
ncbi:uncharacterized protein LOC141854611 [Brevipalpus obovatus]|uniref:uncharacterized protein LOC141854611 n=1 Tax=Brevipalpus obovatus TaxID=246614 RepID=UPI003D9E7B3E